MYKIDDQSFDKQAFPAGIHQNVELVSVTTEALATQNFTGTVLKFRFEDAESFFEHTEFEVSEANSHKNALNWNQDPDKRYREDLQGQAKRIAHILSCFMPKEKLAIEADSWEDFCEKVVALVGDSYTGVKLRIKLIYDKKDYCRFPMSTVSAWIQRMDQPNKLIINPKYERIVPLEPDPEAAKEDAPAVEAGEPKKTKW